jgi:hypothetical protein
LLDDLLSILLGELLVFAVAFNGLLDLRDFGLREIATLILALFPGVEVVVRAVRPLADSAEGAVLHALDLEELLEEGLWSQWCIHGVNIYVHLYLATKNSTI